MLAKISRLFSTSKVPTDLLQNLRKMTQVSISDCHKALQQSQNNIEKALEYLRNKGLTTSQKRIDKQTKQGVIASFITSCRRKAVLLEVNSETDFVAKSDLFLSFVDNIGQTILNNENTINIDGLSDEETKNRFDQFLTNCQPSNIFPQDKGIKNMGEQLKLLKSKFQQNIRVRRALTFYTEGCRYGYYIHMPYKANIGLQGSIVELSADPEITEEENDEIVNEFADNIATQILGSPPKYISFEEIPEDVIEAETAKAQAEMAERLQKAPEQARPNIISGKLMSSFYSKTLLGCMPYLLSNEGAQVSQIWEEVQKSVGSNISIHRAVSWEVK